MLKCDAALSCKCIVVCCCYCCKRANPAVFPVHSATLVLLVTIDAYVYGSAQAGAACYTKLHKTDVYTTYIGALYACRSHMHCLLDHYTTILLLLLLSMVLLLTLTQQVGKHYMYTKLVQQTKRQLVQLFSLFLHRDLQRCGQLQRQLQPLTTATASAGRTATSTNSTVARQFCNSIAATHVLW
jgi:hypothetical protein